VSPHEVTHLSQAANRSGPTLEDATTRTTDHTVIVQTIRNILTHLSQAANRSGLTLQDAATPCAHSQGWPAPQEHIDSRMGRPDLASAADMVWYAVSTAARSWGMLQCRVRQQHRQVGAVYRDATRSEQDRAKALQQELLQNKGRRYTSNASSSSSHTHCTHWQQTYLRWPMPHSA
jgi:hypothetical protein